MTIKAREHLSSASPVVLGSDAERAENRAATLIWEKT
jgi:hypothetical protein